MRDTGNWLDPVRAHLEQTWLRVRSAAARFSSYQAQKGEVGVIGWLPGWDSLDAASWWGAFYFWVCIGSLALVAVSAVLSNRYSVRKDELVVQATTRKVLEYRTQANNFQLRLASATARHLTDLQRRTLVAALADFPGQPVRFKAPLDQEAQGYRDEFVQVAQAAHWTFDPATDVLQGDIQPKPTGIQITMNEVDAQEGHVPDAIKALVAALHILGITKANTIFTSAEVPSGTIDIVVGSK